MLKIFLFCVFIKFVDDFTCRKYSLTCGCLDQVIMVDHMTQIGQSDVRSKQEVTRKKEQIIQDDIVEVVY